MPSFLNPLTRAWITLQRKPYPVCGLATCPGPHTLWQRITRRPMGAFLQGVFYCQPQCLETALAIHLSRLYVAAPAPLPSHRIPLGLLMVARGKLTYVEVQAALEAQRRARHGKIGDWIEKLGFATEQDVTSALALQWGCPVASSANPAMIDASAHIPLPLLEAFHMFPWNHAPSTNTLHVAFGERVDHAALYAIEKILDCRTQACVAPRKGIATALDHLRQRPRPSDVEFENIRDFAEMSRISSSYITRLSPDEVRLTRLGSFIWIRLNVRSAITNVLFRLPGEPSRSRAASALCRPSPSTGPQKNRVQRTTA
jgi:hypothetical protein